MSNDFFVVTGATGHIGGGLAQGLLAKGHKVKAVGRDKSKLSALAKSGAEAVSADLGDAKALTAVFKGAKAVFLLIPPSYGEKDFIAYQSRIGEAQIKAVSDSGVGQVVNLSSVGGHLSEKNGTVKGLHAQETRLNALPKTSVVHLRPAYFMENLLMNIGLIKGQGINGSPLKADAPIPMIATKDSAQAALDEMLKGFTGKSARELLGPRDVTMTQATTALGAAIGKPDLKYVQFPYADAEKAMIGMGLTADLAGLFIEMYRGFNEGVMAATEKRSAANTTPTDISQFAKVFAEIYLKS